MSHPTATAPADLEYLRSGAEVFHSIRWRLEMPVATRSTGTSAALISSSTTSVMYSIELTTEVPTVASSSSSSSSSSSLKTRWMSCDYETLVNFAKIIEDAQQSVRTSAAYRRIHQMVK
mmetsp:Transcript_32996/g.38338  ORF Transcript_32996/g.38338 Transcript_32996/m.38338 type:complete len:119 (-) Transcript_32996:46-402(-)